LIHTYSEFVMAGHSRPKDGVLSPAYVPAIHVFALVMAGLVPAIHVFSCRSMSKTWMASEVGLARLPHKPCRKSGEPDFRIKRDEPGHDIETHANYSISAAIRFRIWMKRLRSRSPMT
jgi:hypothetical protein